jgi:hypothetical protein
MFNSAKVYLKLSLGYCEFSLGLGKVLRRVTLVNMC